MGMNVIVSACFNTHEDPQLNRKISADPSYFLKWYNSILKLGLMPSSQFATEFSSSKSCATECTPVPFDKKM